MFVANLLFSTRSIALRIPLATLRSTACVALRRAPLATGFLTYRALSTSLPTFSAAAAKPKSAAPKTARDSKSEPKRKAKPKAQAKQKPKARATKRKVAAAPKVSTRVPLPMRPPKRPPSAFIIFYNRAFPSPSHNPGGVTSASKEAGAAWHRLSDSEKKHYHDEAKLLNEKYFIERDKWYKDPNNFKVLRTLNKDRKKRGKTRIHVPRSSAVKRPSPPFLRFFQELRETNVVSLDHAPEGTTTRAIWAARESGGKWNALPPSEKEKYTKAFHEEFRTWKQSSAPSTT